MNTKSQKTKSLTYRILLTLSLLSIVRLGSFIPLPYIDKESFTKLIESETSSTNALAQVLNTFSGVGTKSFGLLSLGILPYINASIVIQLFTKAIPSLSKMQKEEGEYGRRKLTDYVRYLTLFWAIIESIGLTYSLRPLIFDWSFWTAAQISLTLISGSMIVLWFSELITKGGLGNGSSLLICFNIVSSLPEQVQIFLLSLKDQTNALSSSVLLILVFFFTTIGCLYINEAIIKIPLISPNQLSKNTKRQAKNLGNTTLPLKVNQAGVMPLVFTSYAMVILSSLTSVLKAQYTNPLFFVNDVVIFWAGKLLFWAIYARLIFFFTNFYSTLVLDPEDVTERLRKNSVVILGIGPGNPTKRYLSKTLRRIARINAMFLISNIVGVQMIESLLSLNLVGLKGLGFTSQLILVNVLMDTLKRVQSFLNEGKSLT